MLPLKATTPKAAELSEANDEKRQIAPETVSGERFPGKAVIYNERTFALASQVRNVAADGEANIHRALAILRADLKVVEETIQALESIAAEGRTEVTTPMRKPRKVVDIHTKRA